MFSKSIKNKALCFLLTVAAVCPAEEVKSSSDTIVHEKTSTIETIDINGMPFCLSSSEETLAIKQEVPASTKETQEIKVEGLPFLIEKVDGEVEKSNVDSSKAELNDLLNLSPVQFVEKPVQSAKTEPLSQEKKQKLAEEMDGLLSRLDSGNVDSTPKVSSDLKQALALTGDFTETEEKSSQQSNGNDDIPNADTELTAVTQPQQPIRSDDSLAAFQDLNEEIEEKHKKVEPVVVKVEQKTPMLQNHPTTVSKDKEIAGVVGGIALTGLMLTAAGIILSAPSSKPKKKRKKSDMFRDDSVVLREIVNEVIQSPEEKLSLTENDPEQKVEQKEAVSEAVIGSKDAVTESKQNADIVSVTTAEQTDASEQKPETSATVSEENSINFSDVWAKKPHELFQWLCAVKSIYDIQKERSVLKREMVRAKNEDNQEEINRITARRKVLNAKRRAACLRANEREMNDIKTLRRELTRNITKVKRGKNIDAATREDIEDKVASIRWSLNQHVKHMNAQIRSFDYAKQWRSFLEKYKQSRQAA